MNILVTGGTGFIGGHLVEELITLGHDVSIIDIAVDNKSYFTRNRLHSKSKFTLLDIRDYSKLKDYLTTNEFDYIFHLAAKTIVEEAYINPQETLEVNIGGSINLFEAVRNTQIKGVIFASSDKAYGKTTTTYTEENPLRGDHPYDVSKSSADLIAQMYYKTYNVPIVIARFGNVYGEGDLHINRLIPGICEAVTKNKTLDIRSNGKYVRDYLYVKDVVNGYLSLLDNFTHIKGEAFNFSSLDKLSVIDVLRLVEKSIGKKIKYKILNNTHNEIPYQHLDDAKVKKLGWTNKYRMQSTFNKIIDWYKEVL